MSAINQVDYNGQWKKTNFVNNPNLSLNPKQECFFERGMNVNERLAPDYLHPPAGTVFPPGCVVNETQAKEVFQASLGISKEVEKQKVRLQYQQLAEEMKIEYRIRKETLEWMVSWKEDGRLVLSVCDGERLLKSKYLTNVTEYSAIRYFSSYPIQKTALIVSWKVGQDSKRIVFDCEKLTARTFWQMLKSQGLRLNVSGRKEQEVADALYAFTVNTAKAYELPAVYGWCKSAEGKWQFITAEKVTLEEVLRNAF